jgi:hypothetical protein
MGYVTTCTCPDCDRRCHLLPNLSLRKAAAMGMADFQCPWCGSAISWAPGHSQWTIWKEGRAGWLAGLSEELAAFRVEVALSGDRVAELIGPSDA